MKVEAKLVSPNSEKHDPQDAEAKIIPQRIWSLPVHGKPRSPTGVRFRFCSSENQRHCVQHRRSGRDRRSQVV